MLERSDWLMTPIEIDENALPPRARALLKALRDHANEWLDRNRLADLTGKRRLSPNDIALLDRLKGNNLIEERTEYGTMRPYFVYRVK